MQKKTIPREKLALDTTLFRAGERVVAAVSGGADSVALLLALHAACKFGKTVDAREPLGVGLAVAHVHHGIRGAEADADAEFVRALAARLGLALHLHHADVPAQAAANGETLEEAARNARYGFFRQLLDSGEADVVATAHTLDDQAETVLMKLVRGAWTEGLGGIHPVIENFGTAGMSSSSAAKAAASGAGNDIRAEARTLQNSSRRRGKIVRPMLAVRRAEIEAWLRAQGESWREDASNLDPAHTRNRARAEWLPMLRKENPKIDEALARVALLARDEEARWQAELARLLPSVLLPGEPVRGGGRNGGGRAVGAESRSVSILLERLRVMDPALRRRVVRAAAAELGVALAFEPTARILALCGLPEPMRLEGPAIQPRTGSRLSLPSGLTAQRTARELRLLVAEKK